MAPMEMPYKKRRRNGLKMTALRWGSIALLFVSAVAVEGSKVAPFTQKSQRDERDLRYSNDQESDPPVSVPIKPFDLQLTGEFPDNPSVDDVIVTIESFLTQYVGKEATANLEDLFLSNGSSLTTSRRQLRRLTKTSMDVVVAGGVVFYTNDSNNPTPTEAEQEAIIATGLEDDFPDFVNNNVEGVTVTSSTFVSSTPAPTSAPAPASSIEMPNQDAGGSKKRGIIAAGATGAFLGILIVAAALLVRRHRGPSLDEYLERARANGDSTKDNATHIQSSIHDDGGDERLGKSSSGETTSTGQRELNAQDDSSQWTLSTYPEDAQTVLTFGTGKSVVTSTNNAIDRAESFERDRQVSLRKDMLNTSPGWNATEASAEEPAKRVDDTVLESSTFVTADEPPTPPPPPAASQHAARFAANDEGEEIYLMPPANKRASKVSFQDGAAAESK